MSPKSSPDLARILWDYCNFRTPVIPADVIIVLCSHDIRIASYSAGLFLEGLAPKIVFSGGLSDFTSRIYPVSEAETFSTVAVECGVPVSAIIQEDQSTNTQENLEFSFRLLKEKGFGLERAILIQKPNMLRRVHATAQKLFPEVAFSVTSHNLNFSEAPHSFVTEEMLIHELVGDVQRLKLYTKRGFIREQSVPEDVWEAFEELRRRGFTGNLVK